MCHAFLSSVTFLVVLLRIDRDLAAQARSRGCPYCGGPLHAGDYRRKVGGPPASLCVTGYQRRYSLCCGHCRQRTTPPSVRFFGRRRYAGPWFLVVSAFAHGRPAAARELCAVAGIHRRTLARWRAWWTEAFPRSRFWASLRGRFARPPAAKRMPLSLLDSIQGSLQERVRDLLYLLLPLTTTPGLESHAM